MNATSTKYGVFVAAVALVLVLAGCASPASREGMALQNPAFGKQFPYSVRVQTSGGADTGAVDTINISDADLKAAIEEAVVQSKLFAAVVQGKGGSDYELNVRVISLSKPLFGGTLTVEFEAAWSLTRVEGRSVVMRKSVKSSGSVTMGEAFAFVTRARLAVEAAARENISLGLKTISGLDL